MDENRRVVVGVRREHQASDLGADGLDLPADLDPVAIGEPHVENGHVRLDVADELQALLRCSRLADDFHVVLGLEQRTQARPHQFVIVEHEDPDRHPVDTATRPTWRRTR